MELHCSPDGISKLDYSNYIPRVSYCYCFALDLPNRFLGSTRFVAYGRSQDSGFFPPSFSTFRPDHWFLTVADGFLGLARNTTTKQPKLLQR